LSLGLDYRGSAQHAQDLLQLQRPPVRGVEGQGSLDDLPRPRVLVLQEVPQRRGAQRNGLGLCVGLA
jgi:hypothetical protein